MDLSEYLDEATGKPWVWGSHDCTAWPARWACINIPAYSTAEEAAAMIACAGSLVALWMEHGASLIEPVTDLEPGDVGIIEAIAAVGPPVHVGAIWSGRRWAFVPQSGGVAAVSTSHIAAWRPACRRL